MPKKNYNPSIDISAVLKEQPLFILRRSELTGDEVFTELGILSSHVISIADIPELSMNILGGKFKTDHILFNPSTKKATALWPGATPVFLSDFLNQYSILSNAVPIYFQAKDLHNRDIPFIRENDKDSQKLFKSMKLVAKKDQDLLESIIPAKCKLKHSPTFLNYWHVELIIVDPSGDDIKRGKKKGISDTIAKYIIEQILPFIARNTIDESNIPALVKAHYILN